ncbi:MULTISPECIES: gluconokinase [unclassified Pseudofrankia]|uniref:gluconokinase n=1 Tax=unclassified Pseudofrankia TaxID=2994372 RepID=UPI0008DA8D50|nr:MULTISPECIES: gluconokinase [unclassified Pseudofrankia]MDT3442426.1 gluconokinase [Pseudofrankia sp. BMG5.37]OHV48962.1 carbohydrate kinase [Pseudofrankia sp. BMG5.36]
MTAKSRPPVLVLMGVSGSGKSTVAALLAAGLGWPFEEGDDLHPPANIEKMASGHPLTDTDRWPWLAAVRSWIHQRIDAGEPGVITCSALRRAYRDTLRGDTVAGSGLAADADVAGGARAGAEVFVYLRGSRDVIAQRLTARHGHFMPTGLLDSQFAALEEPDPDENALTVDVGPAPAATAQTIVDKLGLADGGSWRPAVGR